MSRPPLACPVCTRDRPSNAACPRCGYEELRARPALSLPVGTVLHGEYTVGNPLGKPGGFGITYLAWYNALEQPVAIKEYLPTDLAGRSPDSRTVKSHSLDHEADFRFGIEQFLREARTLARLSHPNIVRVRGFFEENGTAYLVMDYYAGRSLDRLLEERGGRLPEQEAVDILLPILDALQYVHAKNLLHRDASPPTSISRKTGLRSCSTSGPPAPPWESGRKALGCCSRPGTLPSSSTTGGETRDPGRTYTRLPRCSTTR